MECANCEDCGKRVAWVGIWANVVLVLLKLYAGYAAGSKACLADGLHSASNIIIAFVILISRRVTSKKASHNYHFGYGKAEFLAAGFSSFLIIIGAIILISVSIKHLLHDSTHVPHSSAIIVAIISLGTNELLFRYMRCVGTKLKSQTILANAWANRADSFSSIAVIVGVIGQRLGIPHLDPFAALIVVAAIIKISSSILIDSLRSLMDVSVNLHYSEEIKDIVREIEGVRGLEELKTRQIGHYVWVEMNLLVDPLHSLKNANYIGEMVRNSIHDKIKDIERVTLHIKPMVQVDETE